MSAQLTLTRIRLNRHSPAVRRDLASAVDLHKTLMRLIPDELGHQARRTAGLLFRLEHAPTPTLLIQTHSPPALARLPARYGTADTHDLTALLHTALTPGRLVRYRITANASVRRHDPTLPSGSKVTALRGDDALAWWQRRAAQAGLTLHTATATPRTFPRATREDGPYHALTQFDGTAHITDSHLLQHALSTGIGKGKAYGAGLLSLAPAWEEPGPAH